MPLDVSEQTFQREVLDRSRQLPVVVDFWAEWCGPCRALSPALEAAERKRQGRVVLAKVDTDANPGLARQFGIQGIPAVKAFREGKVVDEFVGARPPAQVERFFDGLAGSRADELLEVGDEASLREALELEPGRPDASVSLATILLERGEQDEAVRVLESANDSFAAEGLLARIRLARSDGGELADAFEKLDTGQYEPALDRLIAEISEAAGEDGEERREELRRIVVGALDQLGADDPRAREYRRRLAAALY